MRERTAKLLAEIAREIAPKEILEIGTCLGVSAITVLSSCNGRLTTIDCDGQTLDTARKNFSLAEVADRVTVIEGDCYETASLLKDNRYDLVILDGPKGHTDTLAEILLDMLTDNGVLFVDDIGFHGMTEGCDDPGHKHRTIVRSLRSFRDMVSQNINLESCFYDFEDGVAIIRKKERT